MLVRGQWSELGRWGEGPTASGQHGRQLGPGEYLGAVLSHGVVVEAGLGLELLPAMLTLQCILQLQTGMLVRGRSWGASPLSQGAALPSDTLPCAS